MESIITGLLTYWGPLSLAMALLIYDNLDKRKELKDVRSYNRLMTERVITLGESTDNTLARNAEMLGEIKSLLDGLERRIK